MRHQIASYLFQNKTCPLPGFGNLSLVTTPAITDITNHSITAPETAIRFSDKEINASGLVSYIAREQQVSEEEAATVLSAFCRQVKEDIANHARVEIPGVGNFVVDEHGNTLFHQAKMPTGFLASVTAERVIHPNAEHSMLVGDRETTNTVMTEYLSAGETTPNRWWIWAIVLAAAALLALLFYSGNHTVFFGNAVKI